MTEFHLNYQQKVVDWKLDIFDLSVGKNNQEVHNTIITLLFVSKIYCNKKRLTKIIGYFACTRFFKNS